MGQPGLIPQAGLVSGEGDKGVGQGQVIDFGDKAAAGLWAAVGGGCNGGTIHQLE